MMNRKRRKAAREETAILLRQLRKEHHQARALRTAPAEPFTWTGDLDDDCTCRCRNMTARAELLVDGRNELWYAAVYLDGSDVPLFHSHSDEIHPRSAAAARKICELVMKDALSPLDTVDAARAELRATAQLLAGLADSLGNPGSP